MFSYRLRRRAHWKLMQLGSIIWMRRRMILAGLLLSLSRAVLLGRTTNPVYGATVTLRLNQPVCSKCGRVERTCDGIADPTVKYCECQ